MSIDAYQLVFWDFDGVIKESVDIKTGAFVHLFENWGMEVAAKVRAHHLANGGMSRFDKLPLYLRWAGKEPDTSLVNEFCERFSRLVLRGVINAPWVPGAERLLRFNPYRQNFVLVSATPQEELDLILQALDLTHCFSRVFGAPISKALAIGMSLADFGTKPDDCLMIGDARVDMEAAQANGVPFLLRLHATNTAVFSDYAGMTTRDLTSL